VTTISRAIIAAVRSRGRVSRPALRGWALTFSLVAAPQSIPPADLVNELAARIAAAADATAPVHLVPVSAEAGDQLTLRVVASDLATLLSRRGLRIVDTAVEGASVVSFTCSKNVRERVCAAAIRNGAAQDVVVATAPFATANARQSSMLLVPELRPLIGQSDPILDVVVIDRRMLVLDPFAVTLYEKSADGWRRRASQPIPATRPWPRDVRGRLRVDAGTWEAFLPGMACTGNLEPLGIACTDGRRPWPLGLENDGIETGRNVLLMPAGEAYFSAAPLGSDAAARWLLAGENGRLSFLDAEYTPLQSMRSTVTDVAAISTTCVAGTYVIVPQPDADGRTDTLRVVRVVARQLVDITPPAALPGRVTALWTGAPGDHVIAVAREANTGWYEAFQVGLSCGR